MVFLCHSAPPHTPLPALPSPRHGTTQHGNGTHGIHAAPASAYGGARRWLVYCILGTVLAPRGTDAWVPLLAQDTGPLSGTSLRMPAQDTSPWIHQSASTPPPHSRCTHTLTHTVMLPSLLHTPPRVRGAHTFRGTGEAAARMSGVLGSSSAHATRRPRVTCSLTVQQSRAYDFAPP